MHKKLVHSLENNVNNIVDSLTKINYTILFGRLKEDAREMEGVKRANGNLIEDMQEIGEEMKTMKTSLEQLKIKNEGLEEELKKRSYDYF